MGNADYIKKEFTELNRLSSTELRLMFQRDDALSYNYPHYRSMSKRQRIIAVLGKRYPNDDIEDELL